MCKLYELTRKHNILGFKCLGSYVVVVRDNKIINSAFKYATFTYLFKKRYSKIIRIKTLKNVIKSGVKS